MKVMNSLVVQWLGRHAFSAKFLGSIPLGITKIPQAMLCGKNKKKVCNGAGDRRDRQAAISKRWKQMDHLRLRERGPW